MTALDRKLLRDLWRMRGQALAIALVIGAAMATFVMALGVQRSLVETRDAYYDRYQFAEIFVSMTRAPRSVVDRVGQIEGVARAEGRIEQFATLNLPDRTEPIRAKLNSVGDNGASQLNRLVVLQGRGPQAGYPREVVIDEAFARTNGLVPSDEITAIIYGNRIELKIVGIGQAPDHIWAIAPGELVPDAGRFGVFWIGERALEAASGQIGSINALSIIKERGASEAELIRRIDAITRQFGGTGAIGREDHLSHAFLQSDLDQLGALVQVIPPIFLVVSTFLVYVVLSRTIRTERGQIGLLKAFGYTNTAVGLHYLKFAIVIAFLGIVLGAVLGSWMGQSMTGLYAKYYRLPFLIYQTSPNVQLIGAMLAIGSAGIGALGGVRAAIKLTPAVAMAPPPPPIYRAGLMEAFGAKAGFTSIGNMILRHITRWPGRSSITVVGVATSLGLLFATLQFIDGSRAMLDNFFSRAQHQDITVSFIEPRNNKILHELATMDGVIRVEGARAVPVVLRHGARSERAAIETGREGDTLTARVDAAGNVVPLPAAGLMLSRLLASKLDIAPGEEIEVELLGGRQTTTTMTVASTIDELVGTRAYARSDTVDRLTLDAAPVGSAQVLIDPAMRDDILSRLNDMPIVLGVTERTSAMLLFEQIIEENILTMMFFYVLFASAIAVGVVYNSARILFSERAHELATMRVLGYHRREVAFVLLSELALLIAVAVPVGCFIGYWLARLMVAAFSSDLFRLPFAPERSSYGFATLVVLLSAAATAMIVARRVIRLDMVRVLKARD